MFAYSKNRKATQPCRITLSGMGTAMSEKISKLTGFDTWLGVATDSRCYTEIFDKGNSEKERWIIPERDRAARGGMRVVSYPASFFRSIGTVGCSPNFGAERVSSRVSCNVAGDRTPH